MDATTATTTDTTETKETTTHPPTGDAERGFELPDGRRLVVRDATPDDVEAVGALFGSLSLDDRYRRFFSGFRPSHSFVADWISAGTRGGASLVAEVIDERGPTRVTQVVGEAGYAPLPDGAGEFAVTVAHDWRGWLGPYLLDQLCGRARAAGLRVLEAEILTENRPMRAVVDRRGDAVLDRPDWTIVRVAVATDEEAHAAMPVWPPNEQRHRVLVEAPGGRWRGDAELRKAGVAVATCAGPGHAGHACPALEGRPCPLAQGATLIVCALPPGDERTEALVAAHRRLAPGVPLLVDRGAAEGDLRACTTGAEVVRRVEEAIVNAGQMVWQSGSAVETRPDPPANAGSDGVAVGLGGRDPA